MSLLLWEQCNKNKIIRLRFLHACRRHCAVAEYQKNLRNAEAERGGKFLFWRGFANQHGLCPKKSCDKQKNRADKMRMKQKREDDFRKKRRIPELNPSERFKPCERTVRRNAQGAQEQNDFRNPERAFEPRKKQDEQGKKKASENHGGER